MKWTQPPVIKIYEALGAVADGRITVEGNVGKVYSSSGNKYYDVVYDPHQNAIMTNDNGSYWKGYLGYPAIAFLFKCGVLEYRDDMAPLLKGIAWKDINQMFKNDFDKTIAHIFSSLSDDQQKSLRAYAEEVGERIEELNLSLLGEKVLPPEGY